MTRDYGHDEALRDLDYWAYTTDSEDDWQRHHRLAAYISRLESDNAALLGVAKVAYEALDEALSDTAYGWCRIEHGMLGMELAALPDHIKETLR